MAAPLRIHSLDGPCRDTLTCPPLYTIRRGLQSWFHFGDKLRFSKSLFLPFVLFYDFYASFSLILGGFLTKFIIFFLFFSCFFEEKKSVLRKKIEFFDKISVLKIGSKI